LGRYRAGAKVNADLLTHCCDENGKELCKPFKYMWQLKVKSKITFGKGTGLYEVIKSELHPNNIVKVILRKVAK
jgi:hypothetical protein